MTPDGHAGGGPRHPPERLPVLTEVVDVAVVEGYERTVVLGAPVDLTVEPTAADDADAVVARVLQALQPQVDALLEARLREALAPALARVADTLIRDVRRELAPALRELVHDAVARASRPPAR